MTKAAKRGLMAQKQDLRAASKFVMLSFDKDTNYVWCDFSEGDCPWNGYEVVSRLLRKETIRAPFKALCQMSMLFYSPSHDQEAGQRLD